MARPKKIVEQDNTGLIRMVKDGEELYVHPNTVDAHIRAGWKVAE